MAKNNKKRKYQVIKATTRPQDSIKVDDAVYNFGKKQAAMTIVDEGLAKEIDARFGRRGTERPGDVVVVPVEVMPEEGHRRTWTVPELPWKK